jgi:mannose-6-phosphate isomerase-like protein (cupin superfamily)
MNNIIKRLLGQKALSTNHGSGKKFVFMSNVELENSLTQIAFGLLKPKEGCDFHIHETMDEYFYFIKGNGKYYIESEVYELIPNTFLEIKAHKKHALSNDGDIDLEFIYWGIAK